MQKLIILLFSMISLISAIEPNQQLQKLSDKFWQWRAVTQPAQGDDIMRIERPDGWQPDYSPEALEAIRDKYKSFKQMLYALPCDEYSRSDSVDYLCIRSAIERVNWEFNVLGHANRNPDFYVHQTLGAVYELLLIHSPMTAERAGNIIIRLESFPKTIADAKLNLTEPVAPFALIALQNLSDIRTKLLRTKHALLNMFPENLHQRLESSTRAGIDALEDYEQWIRKNLPGMSSEFSCGREAYEYFLNNIAYIPYSPEELLQQGRMEWNRALAFESFENVRNRNIPPAELFKTSEAQIAQEKMDEQAIRDFLEANAIMTVPDWLQHYYNKKMPDHIVPLSHMGVVDDLTSESRLDENGVAYIPEPGPHLSYFRRACAQDPRPIIIHEGVPGHYFQLAISWAHPNPIRRRYVDSGANEGIGLYVEELMQQFGLFDDRPHTREIIYNFMRLRALRVEIDIRLALGTFSIEEAGAYLAKTVPMDNETAVQEAGFFAYNPGQAITYQIGKNQILQFLADARLQQGSNFNLRKFHDYLILNGNIPIALLRWELLGHRDEIARYF